MGNLWVRSVLVGMMMLSASALLAQDLDQEVDESRLLKSHSGSSPYHHPEPHDSLFVADTGAGLDTGCTYGSSSPLTFTIEVDRVVGDIAELRGHRLISENATLRMPAFDVDFAGGSPDVNPERDRVMFNGRIVPGEFLTGSDGIWKYNTFSVPIDWVEFPEDPGPNGQVEAVENVVEIFVDVDNAEDIWCTAIDWAVLDFEVARPVVFVHGIFPSGRNWKNLWVPRLEALGLLTDSSLQMGNLDSIQNNARKIGQVVENAKRRWGVDRVNIVSHSKGGIDSRHFAETSDSIDEIIQLGTPNAGSPLADVVQAGVIVGLGFDGARLANELAGPAGIQLTRPYMRFYNRHHVRNPDVIYTAWAGDYDPACPWYRPVCRPLTQALLAITGPGDRIVPITSVHALNYTRDRRHPSSGDDQSALHSKLDDSGNVYEKSSARVQRYGRTKSVAPDTEAAQTATSGGTLALDETAVHEIAVDETEAAYLTLMYSGGSVSFSLVSPSGREIDPAVAEIDPEIGFEDDSILGGSSAVYALIDPEVGVWTVEVAASALDEASGSVTYTLGSWLETPDVMLEGSAEKVSVGVGEAIDFSATVSDQGTRLTGITVLAVVTGPDGETTEVILTDDGTGNDETADDGFYSGLFDQVITPGYYRIVFQAVGETEVGNEFSRECLIVVTASESRTELTGSYEDFGLDTDGDGLFNFLVIQAGIEVTTAADYRLIGLVTDEEGHTHEVVTESFLEPGTALMELEFDGEGFFDNRVDGPYTLSAIRLAEVSELGPLPLLEIENSHVTEDYDYRQFEHEGIEFLSGFSEGIDLDGNELFDQLAVTLEVEVTEAGTYEWSGLLLASDGTELGFGSGSAHLPAGATNITLLFDGFAIGEAGLDGPYQVSSLLILGGASSLVVNTAFETLPYRARQFEGFSGFSVTEIPTLSQWTLLALILLLMGSGVLALRG